MDAECTVKDFVMGLFQGCRKQVECRDGVRPVSYTHLDVYKRQLLNELVALIVLFRDDVRHAAVLVHDSAHFREVQVRCV